MRTIIITAIVLVGVGCADNRTRPGTDTGAGLDTSVSDTGMTMDAAPDTGTPPMDAAPDAADTGVRMDAALDTSVDSVVVDATPDVVDAMPDTMVVDTGVDTGGPVRVVIESAMHSTEDSSGVVVDERFYSGWRFQVPAPGLDVDLVGFYGWVPTSGLLFAAIVQLSGPSDTPDMSDLSGTDVVATALKDPGAVPYGSWIDIDFSISTSLAPGWYAVVFGSNAFGADPMAGGNMQNMTGARTAGAQGIFTLRQSDGLFILQSGTKRVYVEGFEP